MFQRLTLLALGLVGLLVAGPALAAEPCAEMVRLQAAHTAHAALPDSNPATLNRLLTDALTARDACFKKYQWSREVDAAVNALAHPVYVVPASAITSGALRQSPNAYDYDLFAEIPGHGKVIWGVASLPCTLLDGKCFNPGPAAPNMYIDTRVTIDGREVVIQIRGEESKRMAATTVALRILHERFEEAFKKPLAELSGHLAAINLANFQQEFAERRYKKGQSEDEAKQGAIRAISFGKHRMAPPFNYRAFTVVLGDWEQQKLKLSGDREAVEYRVPAKVDITAKDRQP
ncbi:MAG: hypothetical protein KC549_09865 [Myxococcales bacterium]|nr:hypothetical protein [Myxococcales bacterium]